MRIGVFCSGGDAPGMNACIRAVVRAALAGGHEVVGIRRGYQGLLEEDFHINAEGQPRMTLRCVSNILQRGGTILHTSRCSQMYKEAGQRRAAEVLHQHGIDALVPIGGDGTIRGAMALSRFYPGRIVSCPGTIDNDLCGTDATIGFYTAVSTAVEAMDKVRDTAESHERLFLVEVMGRHSGYIALYSALAGGAEIACIPETPTDIPAIVEQLRQMKARGKTSVLMMVAEGDELGGAADIQRLLQEHQCPYPTRAVVLGHLQRGGCPVPEDRLLALQLGAFAVECLEQGHSGCMVGVRDGRPVRVPWADAVRGHHRVPPELVRLLEAMSR